MKRQWVKHISYIMPFCFCQATVSTPEVGERKKKKKMYRAAYMLPWNIMSRQLWTNLKLWQPCHWPELGWPYYIDDISFWRADRTQRQSYKVSSDPCSIVNNPSWMPATVWYSVFQGGHIVRPRLASCSNSAGKAYKGTPSHIFHTLSALYDTPHYSKQWS